MACMHNRINYQERQEVMYNTQLYMRESTIFFLMITDPYQSSLYKY